MRLLGVAAAVTGLVVVAQPVSASAAEYQRTVRVNVSSTGAQAETDYNYHYHWPAISADGRCVAFTSLASNLVPPTPTGAQQFVSTIMSSDRLRRSATRRRPL